MSSNHFRCYREAFKVPNNLTGLIQNIRRANNHLKDIRYLNLKS